MRHPFDRLLPAPPQDSSPNGGETTRRAALGRIAAGGAALYAIPLARAAAREAEGEPASTEAERLYLIAPRDVRRFSRRRREELGVRGIYINGWRGNEKLRETRGYLAWITPAQAAEIARAEEVAFVHQFTPEDTYGPGERPAATDRLTVQLHPNAWPELPRAGSYASQRELAEAWSNRWREKFPAIRVTAGAEPHLIEIELGGELPEEVAADLRACPQVLHFAWRVLPPTVAGREEGVTTLRLGEEGAPRPTTLAVGEEGGPTTEAVGEEGGVTTFALGEEGAPLPSTRRLGEEGGVPEFSTQALGEEGGAPRR